MTSSAKEVKKSAHQFKQDREVEKVVTRLQSELKNIVVVSSADSAAYLVNASQLAIKTPQEFPNTEGCDDPIDFETEFVSGVIPFPGRNINTLPSTLASVDPSIEPSTDQKSDGIRFIHLSSESQAIPLARNDTDGDGMELSDPGFETADTMNPSGTHIQARFPLRVESAGDFETGDYAVVGDWGSAELIRITNIEPDPDHAGLINIEHSDQKSIWNEKPFTRHYSLLPGSVAILQKVELVDYAHDPVKEILYRDRHTYDDHFNPNNRTFGAVGRNAHWDPASTQIKEFQVIYHVDRVSVYPTSYHSYTGSMFVKNRVSTRAPRAWPAFDASCNELGYPNFVNLTLRVALTDRSIHERSISVPGLSRSPHLGSSQDLAGDPLFLPSGNPPSGSCGPGGCGWGGPSGGG